MKRFFMYLGTGIMVLASVSCKHETREQKMTLPLIKTVAVGSLNSIDRVEYMGIIGSEQEASISFKVSGQLENLPFREGVRVSKGSVLASLDRHDFEVQYNAAKAVYEQSNKEAERIRTLYEAKTVSPNDYEKVMAANTVAKAKYNTAKDALEYTEIKAPFDGFISGVFKNEGEVVSAGLPVLYLKSDNEYYVEINMAIKDFKRLEFLRSARLDIGGSSVELKLRTQSRNTTSGQLYRVSFNVPKKFSSLLMAGMNVSVALDFSKEETSVSIPATALFYKDGFPCVWKINDDKVHCIPLKIGGIEKERVLVSGLQPGDRIAVTGTHSLSEGTSVEEMEDTSETNIGGML